MTAASDVRILDQRTPQERDRPFLPGMGRTWLLPFYDLFTRVAGIRALHQRAVSLADTPNRRWPDALQESQAFLDAMSSTRKIGLGFEYQLQDWASGYYLNNAKLRFEEILRRQVRTGEATPEASTRIERLTNLHAEPHETWMLFCHEAERLARHLGCTIPQRDA